jgi:sulfite exporter TauE/SafE
MVEQAGLVTALLVGFFGSGHCIAMCGGMASALQMMMAESKWQPLILQLCLSIGRITSYSLLGALFGALGANALIVAGFSHVLQLFGGIMLLLMALYVSRVWTVLTKLEIFGAVLWRKIQPFSTKLLPINTPTKALLYGLCWGYLPCGLVYSGLSYSLSSGSAQAGALWMLAFGLGTLPAVLLTGQAAQFVITFKQHTVVRFISAAVLAYFGLYTIYLALRALVF